MAISIPYETIKGYADSVYTGICNDANYSKNGLKNLNVRLQTTSIHKFAPEIEIFTDALIVHFNWKYGEPFNTVLCEEKFKTDFCKRPKKCMRLPGDAFDNPEGLKSFIPQVYKILENHGFFAKYLSLDTVSDANCLKARGLLFEMSEFHPEDPNRTNEIARITADWSIHIGELIGQKLNTTSKEDVVIFIEKIIKILDRAIFLRMFNESCCEKGNNSPAGDRARDAHEGFSIVLSTVRGALSRRRTFYNNCISDGN